MFYRINPVEQKIAKGDIRRQIVLLLLPRLLLWKVHCIWMRSPALVQRLGMRRWMPVSQVLKEEDEKKRNEKILPAFAFSASFFPSFLCWSRVSFFYCSTNYLSFDPLLVFISLTLFYHFILFFLGHLGVPCLDSIDGCWIQWWVRWELHILTNNQFTIQITRTGTCTSGSMDAVFLFYALVFLFLWFWLVTSFLLSSSLFAFQFCFYSILLFSFWRRSCPSFILFLWFGILHFSCFICPKPR